MTYALNEGRGTGDGEVVVVQKNEEKHEIL